MQDNLYDASHVPIDYEDAADAVIVQEVRFKTSRKDERRQRREQRAALERDVLQLQKELTEEVNLRNALNRGLSRPLGCLPRISASLPVETKALFLEVAVLEEEVVCLEKRVMHLRREIENEVPLIEDQSKWEYHTKSSSQLEAEIVLSSPLSSRHLTGTTSILNKPSISPRQPNDQRSNILKPSVSSGISIDQRSSPTTASTSLRHPLKRTDSFSKPLTPSRNSTDNRNTSCIIPPRKSTDQRTISARVYPKKYTDQRGSKLILPTKDLNEACSAGGKPAPPMKLSVPMVNDKSLPPPSSAPESPPDFTKGCTTPSRICKTENGKPPISVHTRSKSKIPDTVRNPPSVRTITTLRTTKPNAQVISSVNQASHPPRLTRKHELNATLPLGKRNTFVLPLLKEGVVGNRNPLAMALSAKGTSVRREFSLKMDNQHPVDARAGTIEASSLSEDAVFEEPNGDNHKPACNTIPNPVKPSEHLYTPAEDLEIDLDRVADSILLSKDLVKLLRTIYGNFPHEQPPLTSDSGSSSRASISTSSSSLSPDDFESNGDAGLKYLEECYGESFTIKSGASLKFMQECFSGEIEETLDPFVSLPRSILQCRSPFQQRLTYERRMEFLCPIIQEGTWYSRSTNYSKAGEDQDVKKNKQEVGARGQYQQEPAAEETCQRCWMT